MKQLEEYITVGTKRMRCGYTTGTCASAAARAAAELLLRGELVPAVVVSTPAGIDVVVEVEEHDSGDGWAECAVRKDSGDDPDVTNGALVYARVERCDEPGIYVDGGVGVGRVTREGLDQPVGAAAINSTPRKMIAEQVAEAAGDAEEAGLLVTVSIPAGVELAAKTFNPRLGIEGGISVLGTSGIVRPMSEDALISSIELEMKTLRARGVTDLLVVPGNYGRDFACGQLSLNMDEAVSCSNYFGATLDAACVLGFERMLIVGHIGKMAKVAGGIMNTHSRVADCRVEVLAAHAALVGATQDAVRQIMGAATTDAALDVLIACGLEEATMRSVMESLADKLNHRVAGALQVEAIVFSNVHGVLGYTPGAAELLKEMGQKGQGLSSQVDGKEELA
ncbi:MAG: cobalamin biosynthesis protein CbiD [Eggerthellaceae bacterium]|nr:cobalamin biosynthesis protein CbiD [Eggerthellaceae bacterium]MBQ9044210.1 cobalamin biosynthesis protein CbiD [Eggerthellaceae bacterium]